MIDKENEGNESVPAFLDIPGLVRDMRKITDAARGKWVSNFMMGLALLKHYRTTECADALQPLRTLQEVRQIIRSHRQGLRQG
jgi:tRNA A-37 threonylcarbamoyl transferase component Bud32